MLCQPKKEKPNDVQNFNYNCPRPLESNNLKITLTTGQIKKKSNPGGKMKYII